MIISRKRFEEEISKAVHKREEELWDARNREEEMRNINRRLWELEGRVDHIEGKNIPCCEPVNAKPSVL